MKAIIKNAAPVMNGIPTIVHQSQTFILFLMIYIIDE